MLEATIIICALILLYIFFRPRRSQHQRNIVSTRNSRKRGSGDW